MSEDVKGVFVRLHDGKLSEQQIADLNDQSMTSLESLLAIGAPVTGGELDASRECFERFYSQMCTQATGCSGVTPDYVRELRCGDNYGGRAFLNNIWEAWPDFVDYALAKLAEKDAEITGIRKALTLFAEYEKLMDNSEDVRAMRVYAELQEMVYAALKGTEA